MGKFSRLGNDLYSGRRSIDFVGRRRLWYTISAVIVLVAMSGLFFKGINWGIEFTGGAQYRVSLPQSQVTQETADDLRVAVASTGVDAASSPVVTTSGDNAILVQTEPLGSGDSDQIVEVLQATDLFALTPRMTDDGDRDGIPNVLVEAMACGVPVVTTAAGGVPELVRDDVNGLLSQPGTTPRRHRG